MHLTYVHGYDVHAVLLLVLDLVVLLYYNTVNLSQCESWHVECIQPGHAQSLHESSMSGLALSVITY